MRDVLKEAQPDVVLVHGDTTASTAAALAAFYQQIPVGHVEAGLRTHNIYSPWPEEMNRLITGCIATYHFSPTQLSRQNLLAENVPDGSITVTGNTVIDALYWVVDKIKKDKTLNAELQGLLATASYDVNRLAGGKKLVLIVDYLKPETCRQMKCFYLLVAITITIKTTSSVYYVPYTNVITYWIEGKTLDYGKRSVYNFNNSPYR